MVGLSDTFIDAYFGRFSEEGLNTFGRADCWLEYFYSLSDIQNVLLGTPIDTLLHTKIFLSGSLQNSYLTLHSREGVFGVVLIVFMIKGFNYLYKNRCMPIIAVISALLFKGITDADMGGIYSGGDIYLYYLILFSFNEGKSFSTLSSSISSHTRK